MCSSKFDSSIPRQNIHISGQSQIEAAETGKIKVTANVDIGSAKYKVTVGLNRESLPSYGQGGVNQQKLADTVTKIIETISAEDFERLVGFKISMSSEGDVGALIMHSSGSLEKNVDELLKSDHEQQRLLGQSVARVAKSFSSSIISRSVEQRLTTTDKASRSEMEASGKKGVVFRVSRSVKKLQSSTNAFREGFKRYQKPRMAEKSLWSVADPNWKELLRENKSPSSDDILKSCEKYCEKKLTNNDLKAVDTIIKELKLNKKQARKLQKLYDKGDINEIIDFVSKQKICGLQFFKAQNIMRFFIKEAAKQSQFNSESQEVLKEFAKEVTWAKYSLEALRMPARNASIFKIKKLRNQLSRVTANVILHEVDKKAKEGKKVGKVLTMGWVGHAVQMEVQKTNEGYFVHVANAGPQDIKHHDGQCSSVRTFAFPDTVEGRKALAKALRRLEALQTERIRKLPSYEGHVSRAKELYDLLRDGSTEIVDLSQGERPSQTSGNCGIHSPEELICNKLQRISPEDADRFKYFMRDTATKSLEMHYPKLAEGLNVEPKFNKLTAPALKLTRNKRTFLVPADLPKNSLLNYFKKEYDAQAAQDFFKVLESWRDQLVNTNKITFEENTFSRGAQIQLSNGWNLEIP